MRSRRGGLALGAVLAAALAIRALQLGAPLIGHHAWRQTDTAAIARNMVEERTGLLHPRVDWRGATSGDVECEFPAYPFALATVYQATGVRETAGRVLSIVCSLLAIGFVWALARAIAGDRVAIGAALYLAFAPLPAFLGRAVMAESLLLAGAAASVYGFLRWSRGGGAVALAAATLAFTLACLIKPQTLTLGLPIAALAWRRHGWRFALRPELLACAAIVIAALVLWYAHAHALGVATGLSVGVWGYGSDKWGNWGLIATAAFWHRLLLYWFAHLYLLYFGAPVFVAALFLRPAGADEHVMRAWLVAALAGALIVARGTFVHDYYLLLVSVPVAYWIGKGFAPLVDRAAPAWLRAGLAVCAIGMAIVAGTAYRGYLGRESPARSTVFRLAEVVRRVTPEDVRLVAIDDGDPTLFYLAHRKGWHAGAEILNDGALAARRSDGARYLVGLREFVPAARRAELDRLLAVGNAVPSDSTGFVLALGP